MWWIEHDIPPHDRYHCEAYRVTLTLDAGNEPVLTVETGISAYPVAPLTTKALEAALARAGESPPLVMAKRHPSRRHGEPPGRADEPFQVPLILTISFHLAQESCQALAGFNDLSASSQV